MNILNYLKKDEIKAPKDYHRLLKAVRTKHDKGIVRGIIRQERKHLIKLKRLNFGG